MSMVIQKVFLRTEDEEEKPPKDNVNKEGEAAADNNEEDGCTDESTDVMRPVDRDVKFRLRRDVVHQVTVQSPKQGQTGSHERFNPHLGHEHQVKEQDEMLKVRGLTFSVPSEIQVF